jgi:hypothetical protein
VIIRAAETSADVFTYLALLTTPPLAAAALGYTIRGGRPLAAPAVVALFLVAGLARGHLAGDAAALLLTAAACVTLATLLAAVAPAPWLKAGLLLMSAADTVLVIAQLLQAPNDVLNAAAPAGGLPQFQRAEFGSAVMGYGDLFVAALLGAILARTPGRQRRAALLATVLALCFGLLFYVLDTLPATVPVAVTLIFFSLTDRRTARRQGSVVPSRP